MRAKKFKQLMEATTASEAEIISYVRRQSVTLEAPARVISIPGSQFVEEEGELEGIPPPPCGPSLWRAAGGRGALSCAS